MKKQIMDELNIAPRSGAELREAVSRFETKLQHKIDRLGWSYPVRHTALQARKSPIARGLFLLGTWACSVDYICLAHL